MFCPECGTQLPDDSTFCTNCGMKLNASNGGSTDNSVYTNSSNNTFNDFDDNQTEIIFDKKLPTDRLKKGGSKVPIIILVFSLLLAIGGAGYALYYTQNVNKEKIAQMQKTGIETVENGKIMYNKGNKVYAYDEIIDEGSSTYYFDTNGEMAKGKWILNKGKWYYCENDGKIAKSKWIASTYYVNEYGEMLVNTTTPDGYLVDADGKWVDQEAILAAQKAAEEAAAAAAAAQRAANATNYNTYNNVTYSYQQQAAQSSVGTRQATNIDYSKEVYIIAYDKYQTYTYFDDDTSVDIIVEYPIFGGQNPEEATKMNNSLQYCLTNEFENYVDGDINSKTDESKPPRVVKINEATIASIEQNKIYVILKGYMERKSAGSVKLNYRFIYERSSGSGYIRD